MLTAEQIKAQYNVDDKGIVHSPGKFEGEPMYVVAYYDLILDGGSDETVYDEYDRPHDFFDVDASDVQNFPDLGMTKRLEIWEDDNGFVHHNSIEWNVKED